jgi:tRNA (adenine37-N6)-methyltransferase
LADGYTIFPIATISTPFNQKFGIPRQANLTSATGIVAFLPELDALNAIKDIEQHSHLWLIFQFDKNVKQGWKELVRPPRLGGNEKTGVLATRSSFRPNALGMSVVKLESVDYKNGAPQLIVSGVDLLNNTPIFDIKPYIPYADSIADAHSQMAPEAPSAQLNVGLTDQAKLLTDELKVPPNVLTLLCEVLAQDPRPAYKKEKHDDKTYHLSLYSWDFTWYIKQDECVVTGVALTEITNAVASVVTNVASTNLNSEEK